MSGGVRYLLAALLAVSAGLYGSAQAAESTTPMLSPADVARNQTIGTEGVTGSASGSLHYPDQIMAYPVRPTDENKDLLTAWEHTHKFFIVPLSVGVEPADGFVPEELALTLTFPGLGTLTKQPIIIDCFPQTGFVASSLTASAHLKLDGNLKFSLSPPAAAGVGAGLDVDYKFAPHYANIVAGFGSGSAFWQFKKTPSNYPAGELPLKLIIAVPNQMLGPGLLMAADVRITYTGPWWTKGTTIGSFRSQIDFPQ